MTDRLNIDYINNTITIKINSTDLNTMEEPEILDWLHNFLINLQTTKLTPGIIKDDIPR